MARRMKAAAFRAWRSKSLARRRQRLIQAKVRSTIQRLGRTTNRCSSLRLTVRPGDRLAIVGRSGVGKSTCLDLLALTLAPTVVGHFTASFNGTVHEIGELWRRGDLAALAKLRARHIGYVLQTGGLLPFLNVRDNATLPLRLLGRKIPTAWAFADRLLEQLEIASLAKRMPAELSLGQRQRAAVRRLNLRFCRAQKLHPRRFSLVG